MSFHIYLTKGTGKGDFVRSDVASKPEKKKQNLRLWLEVFVLTARVRSRASRFVHFVQFYQFFARNFVDYYYLTNSRLYGIILSQSRGSPKLKPMEWLYGTETRPMAMRIVAEESKSDSTH